MRITPKQSALLIQPFVKAALAGWLIGTVIVATLISLNPQSNRKEK